MGDPDFDSLRMDKDKDQPLTGARDASFKHYCSCYPGGKPTYNLKLTKEAMKAPSMASELKVARYQVLVVAVNHELVRALGSGNVNDEVMSFQPFCGSNASFPSG